MPMIVPMAAAAFASAVTFVSATAATISAIGGLTITAGTTLTVAGVAKLGMAAMSLYSMTRKPKAAAGSPSPIAFKADPNAYIPFVAGGPVATGGNIVHLRATGAKHKYLVYLTALSHGGPIHSYGDFTADDSVVTFGADQGEGATGTYLNRMWQRFAVGLMAGTALALTSVGSKDTPGDHGGHPAEWTGTHRLCGIAHTMLCLEADPAKYPAIPKPLWVVRGGPVYDPRKDSTVPGGSGPQRASDRTTWSTDGNQNPFLQALTFAIGHVYNGIRVGGVGMPVKGIDVQAFVYGANVADANNWKIAWVWNTGMRKWDVLATMLQAGAGQPLVRAGMLSCSVEAPRVSLDTITEADLRGDFSVTGSANTRTRKNTLIPRCKSPNHKWAVVPFGEVTGAVYVAEDGGVRRPMEVEYEAVSADDGGVQVRQLAAYDLTNLREGLVATIPCSARFLKYRAGDCLTVNAPSTLMNGQKVVVQKREFDVERRIMLLTVRSETDGKHAYALGQTDAPPPSPTLTGNDGLVIEAPDPDAWTVTPGTSTGTGPVIPTIVVTPTDPTGAHYDDPAATHVVVRYRIYGLNSDTGQPYPWVYEEYPATASRIELKGAAPGTVYEVQIAYRVRGIVGDFRSYGNVTTGDLIATSTLFLGVGPDKRPALDVIRETSALGEAALANVVNIVKNRGWAEALLFLEGKSLGTIVLDEIRPFIEGATIELQHLSLLGVASPDGSSFILDIDTVRISPTETFAQRLSNIGGRLGGAELDILHQSTLIYDLQTGKANVSDLTFLSLQVSGQSANITQLFNITYAQGQIIDASATLAINVNNQITGYKVNGVTREFDILASVFRVWDGVSAVPMFAVDGSGAYVAGSKVRTDSLQNNAVTVPDIQVASWTMGGTGGEQLILAGGVSMARAGFVRASASVAQHFPSGDRNWSFRLEIAGQNAYQCYGANGQDSVPLSGAVYVGAGYTPVYLWWNGQSSVNIDYRALEVLGVMK
ncbi:host specificity protein J [Caulobacter phage W2]|uniref:Host specificity protein J n=2 Tax=Kronosvirus TaxID=3425745 RepID=A0AAF0CD33_9CAUD|nr:host specificity protein J [Caulobacter phage TMCBR4]WDS38387.1 host specificity protein J [Caulobacter phage W2]